MIYTQKDIAKATRIAASNITSARMVTHSATIDAVDDDDFQDAYDVMSIYEHEDIRKALRFPIDASE